MMAPNLRMFMTSLPLKNRVAALILAAICSIVAIPARAQSGPDNTLLQFDFNGANSWPEATADVMPSTPLDIATTVEIKAVGTTAASATDATKANHPTGGLVLGAEVGDIKLDWSVIFTSGWFPVKNTETDLGRLKLSLNLAASAPRPVKLQIESFDAKKRRSGGLETEIKPTATDSYQHFDLDLDSFKPVGSGKFLPTDAFVQFTFIISAPQWTDKASHHIRIKDMTYAAMKPPIH